MTEKTIEPKPCPHSELHVICKRASVTRVCKRCGHVVERIESDAVLEKVNVPDPTVEKTDDDEIFVW